MAFIGFLEGCHVKRNSGQTQSDKRNLVFFFLCQTEKVKQKRRN